MVAFRGAFLISVWHGRNHLAVSPLSGTGPVTRFALLRLKSKLILKKTLEKFALAVPARFAGDPA